MVPIELLTLTSPSKGLRRTHDEVGKDSTRRPHETIRPSLDATLELVKDLFVEKERKDEGDIGSQSARSLAGRRPFVSFAFHSQRQLQT